MRAYPSKAILAGIIIKAVLCASRPAVQCRAHGLWVTTVEMCEVLLPEGFVSLLGSALLRCSRMLGSTVLLHAVQPSHAGNKTDCSLPVMLSKENIEDSSWLDLVAKVQLPVQWQQSVHGMR